MGKRCVRVSTVLVLGLASGAWADLKPPVVLGTSKASRGGIAENPVSPGRAPTSSRKPAAHGTASPPRPSGQTGGVAGAGVVGKTPPHVPSPSGGMPSGGESGAESTPTLSLRSAEMPTQSEILDGWGGRIRRLISTATAS